MTPAEALRVAVAILGAYQAPEDDRPEDCEFGPCADCIRVNCPGRVEECRAYPRVTRGERAALLAVFDEMED